MFPNKNGANGHVWKRPHDVEKEHQRIIKLHQNPKKNSVDNTRVKIMSMHKVFPASGGNPEKMAVKCVSFGVQSKECFGLLGHNGAGKTTLLNMLTGLYPATSGTSNAIVVIIRSKLVFFHSRKVIRKKWINRLI